jgi:hypothetical protein
MDSQVGFEFTRGEVFANHQAGISHRDGIELFIQAGIGIVIGMYL